MPNGIIVQLVVVEEISVDLEIRFSAGPEL
jgi:hypothetical protein